MKNKLQIHPSSIDASLNTWQERADHLHTISPLKTPKNLPHIVGITKGAARFLKIKSLTYLLFNDKERVFVRHFFKRPIHYGIRLIKSYLQKKSYTRNGDFFFYGINDEEEFLDRFKEPKALLIVGFSYCHKPFECPSGRFTDRCAYDDNSPICGQCFIGKITHYLPKGKIQTLFIPTIHYIGEKMFEATHQNSDRQILFLITACEMTLEMFGDWGNMIEAKGIGVRLDGRICNTMEAFSLSERGIKPGLTVVTPSTQERISILASLLKRYSDTTFEKA